MLARSASVPSLTATLASSLGCTEAQDWGPDSGRFGRTPGVRGSLPWNLSQRPSYESSIVQPLASHRLEHGDSFASQCSNDWIPDAGRLPAPTFRKSKSEADLTCFATSCSPEGVVHEPALASVGEEGRSADVRMRKQGRRRSFSQSRTLRQGPGQQIGSRTSRTGWGQPRSMLESDSYDEGGNVMTLTKETNSSEMLTMIGGQQMVCSARGCRPLSQEELRRGAVGFDMDEQLLADEGSSTDPQVTDAYYLRALEDDQENALLLRNYASFLAEIQKDYPRAEEYYERAILANPSDGEVLSQYAKFIYHVHRDVERATNYYEQAVKAAPEDCYILASFASFLWTSESSSASPRPVFELRQEGIHHPEAPGCLIPPVA